VSHDGLVTHVLEKDVLPCPLAAQAVTVNESVVRGARDSSNQAFSRCCSCDRFAANSAIIAFSGGLLVPATASPGHPACADKLTIGSRTLKLTSLS
jgi:hypothetical protein